MNNYIMDLVKNWCIVVCRNRPHSSYPQRSSTNPTQYDEALACSESYWAAGLPMRTDLLSCMHNIGGRVEKWAHRRRLVQHIARHTDGILTRGCLQYTRRGNTSVVRLLLIGNMLFIILKFYAPTMIRGVQNLDGGRFLHRHVPPLAEDPNAVCHHTCKITKKEMAGK